MTLTAQAVPFLYKINYVLYDVFEITPSAAFFKALFGKSVYAEPDPVNPGLQRARDIKPVVKIAI